MGRLFEGLLRDSQIPVAANPANLANRDGVLASNSRHSRESGWSGLPRPSGLCSCLTVWRTAVGNSVIAGVEHDLSAEGMTLVGKGEPTCDHFSDSTTSEVDGGRYGDR